MTEATRALPDPLRYPETVTAMHEHLRARLADVVPDFELRLKAEIAVEVNRLKREQGALILGHNYMEPALFHSVPDYTGDSLWLSRVAAAATRPRIVFCGVRFMAETAKILNPDKTVLLPSARGGCSLAEGITESDVLGLRRDWPGTPVVAYINTTAAVKAESDAICTSGNAAAVIGALRAAGHERIIFVPDEFLARNVARDAGMRFVLASEREAAPAADTAGAGNLSPGLLIGWPARCEVHEKFSLEDVRNIRRQFPDAVVLAHPECRPEVVEAADFSGSTTALLRYVETRERGRYLLLTECSMGDNIAARSPGREMIRLCSVRCPHMNEISLEQTRQALAQGRHVIEVEEETRLRARRALDRMLEASPGG